MKIVEAKLDSNIEFTRQISENWQNPQAIFLTGSTGFLGAFVLKELLDQTTANIYCLLRGNAERIKKNLEFYSLWEEKFASRIIPIIGDLSKPLFGISEEKFKQLARQIDVIYHNGAWVNSACPYSTLEGTNVLGTQEVIKLASLSQTKPVHFVSTIAVFFNKKSSQIDLKESGILETEVPDLSNLQGGYKQSKAAAENLIFEAKKRGLPACIYRPSRIAGDSKTGVNGNTQDFFWSLLKGCIQLGKMPALETAINLVPVDYVSRAIVSLSRQKQSLDKAFNLLNPQPLSWQKLFEEIRACGYALERVSYEELLSDVEKYVTTNPEDELYSSLLLFLSDPETLKAKKPRFDTSNAIEGLANTGISCPPAEKKLLETYISYFQKSNYLPTPSTKPQAPKKTSGFWKSIKSNVKSKNTAFTIETAPRNSNLPLSFAQERLWLLEQLHPGNPVHNLRAVYRLKGAVNIAALEQSIQEIVRRHEILRTTFIAVNGQPVQVISPDAKINLPVIDLGHLSVEEREAKVRQLAAEEAQQSFDLTRGPLLSFKLLRLGEAEYVLIRTIHHIINDVWSDTVLLREVAKLYEAFCAGKPSPLAELSIQYADFAKSQRKWLQGEVLKSQLDYWKQQLGGTISQLDLPVKKSSGSLPSYRGAAQILVLSANLTKEIKVLSHKEGVSLFIALLAAFKTWLYQYSGQTDIIVASPVVGRQQMDTKKLLGYFTNILLLRSDLRQNPSFRQLIGRVSKVTLAATERQYLPFQQLVESVGVPPATLSRVMFTLQNVPSQPEKLGEVGVSLVEMDEGIANFDLSLSVKEKGDRLLGVMRYKRDLFEDKAIEQMLDNFENLLATIIADPDIFLADLPMFVEAKAQGQLDKFVTTELVLPENEIEFIIARIWQEVLQVEKIGVHDNFFELGGRSLAIIRVYTQLREIYNLEISPAELFQNPTIKQIAILLVKETAKGGR